MGGKVATTVRVVFDRAVLRRLQPVDLQTNATYIVTIEDERLTESESSSSEEHPLTQLARLATDMGIDDFAANHDWYAHGRISDEPSDQ
jgi:hypothetical protein